MAQDNATPPARRQMAGTMLTAASVAFLILTAVLAFLGWRAGIFATAEAMDQFLSRMGIWAPLVFIFVQIVQIVIPIIPGALTCTVGVLVFGPVWGFALNYGGIIIGSFLAFCLARRFGVPLIRAVTSGQLYDKYADWLDREQPLFDKLFAAAMFLPFSPDDLLCMLAGVSKMTWRRCLVILIVCKPLFLLPYSVGVQSIAKWLGLLV